MRFTRETAAHYGRRGGQRTVERYGSQHMRTIGVRGFWTTVVRHFAGDARAMVNFFIACGIAAADPVPHNHAFGHDPAILKARARAGELNRLRPRWKPRHAVPDGIELPF